MTTRTVLIAAITLTFLSVTTHAGGISTFDGANLSQQTQGQTLGVSATAETVTAGEYLRPDMWCDAGTLRITDRDRVMDYSIPVWLGGSPIQCGQGVEGRRLSPSEVDAAADAARVEFRAERQRLNSNR